MGGDIKFADTILGSPDGADDGTTTQVRGRHPATLQHGDCSRRLSPLASRMQPGEYLQ